MARILDDRSLDSLFRAARPCRVWLDKPVSPAMIEALWELAKLPPTASGAAPIRIAFIRSAEARQPLLSALPASEHAATLAAPVTALLGSHAQADAAGRDALLQAGYFVLAARALGLDCTPVALGDTARADRAFFPEGGTKSILLCNLGYGDPATQEPPPEAPGFDEACRTL